MKNSFAILALLCFFACGRLGPVGNGHVTTSQRDVSDFRKLSVSSGIAVHATKGSKSVLIKTDENVQELIEAVTEGDTLELRVKFGHVLNATTVLEADISNSVFEGLEASGAAWVTIALSPVESFPLTASGASTVVATELESTELNVDASGASKVTLSGSANHSKTTASGASAVNIQTISLDALAVEVSGASTLNARVATSLTGEVSGASTVNIVGNPSSQVEILGASHVNLNQL